MGSPLDIRSLDISEFSLFADVLHASGPAPDRAENLGLYAWLLGSWDIEVTIYKDDGSKIGTQGNVHAGWVLEGRAIQDVFSVPGLFYGTSIRFYDPHIDAWQVFWIDPLKQVFFRMIGRLQGNDIVNEGKETPELARAYGLPGDSKATVRWIFTDITSNSFHWLSQRSTDGTTWNLQREYFAHRLNSSSASELRKTG
jgi:hypothetical protein